MDVVLVVKNPFEILCVDDQPVSSDGNNEGRGAHGLCDERHIIPAVGLCQGAPPIATVFRDNQICLRAAECAFSCGLIVC